MNATDDLELLVRFAPDNVGEPVGFQQQIGERFALLCDDGSGTYPAQLTAVRDMPGEPHFVALTFEVDAELARQVRAEEKVVRVSLTES